MDCSSQATLSFTISQPGYPVLHYHYCSDSSTELVWVMPSNHLILSRHLLLLPSIFPSIRVFSNESALRIRWLNYWSVSISPSSEYSGLISFRIGWFDLLAVQRTIKSVLQHHNLKASILWCSAFFMVQLSHHTWLLEKLWLKTYLFVDLELNNVIVMMYKKYFGLDARAAGRCHSGPRSWNMQGWLQIDFSTDDKDHDSLSWVIAEAALALLMERRADIHLESSWMPRSSHGKRCGPGALGHIFHLWFQVVILFFWHHCVACKISVFKTGIKTRSLLWKHQILATWTPGNSPSKYFL